MDGKIIYSTLSQDNIYTFYSNIVHYGAPTRIIKKIYVRGGANVVDRKGQNAPAVMTRVTDDEYQCLMHGVDEQGNPRSTYDAEGKVNPGHPSFAEHLAGGYVYVSEVKAKVSKVAKNMTAKDGSAQPTYDELVKLGYKPMKTPNDFHERV